MIKSMLTVGEFAEKMKVSVRTLQYYDQQGLLKPSSYSEGGRRLYSAQDALRLQQILSLKYVGFSLEEIKARLSNQVSSSDIRGMIQAQILMLEEQLSRMQESLFTLKIIENDLQSSKEVDLAAVADAIYVVRAISEKDWLELDGFGDALKSHIERKSSSDNQFQFRLARQFDAISNQMADLVQRNIDPASQDGQAAARALWRMVQDFTDGDLSLLPQLIQFEGGKESWPDEARQRQEQIGVFMGKALAYFLDNNPDLT